MRLERFGALWRTQIAQVALLHTCTTFLRVLRAPKALFALFERILKKVGPRGPGPLTGGDPGDVYFFMLSGVLGVLSGLSNPFGHCDLTGPGVPFAWCAHCASCASSDERGGGRPPHVCVGVAWPGILLIWEAASLSRTAELHPIGSNPTLESLCCGCLRAPEPLEYGFGPKIMNCKKSGKSMKIAGNL